MLIIHCGISKNQPSIIVTDTKGKCNFINKLKEMSSSRSQDTSRSQDSHVTSADSVYISTMTLQATSLYFVQVTVMGNNCSSNKSCKSKLTTIYCGTLHLAIYCNIIYAIYLDIIM